MAPRSGSTHPRLEIGHVHLTAAKASPLSAVASRLDRPSGFIAEVLGLALQENSTEPAPPASAHGSRHLISPTASASERARPSQLRADVSDVAIGTPTRLAHADALRRVPTSPWRASVAATARRRKWATLSDCGDKRTEFDRRSMPEERSPSGDAYSRRRGIEPAMTRVPLDLHALLRDIES